MKKYIYIIFIVFSLSACGTDEPYIGPDEPDIDLPGRPDVEEPEYNKDTQVYINGLIWDKFSAIDYCSFDDAEKEAAKAKKRIPKQAEWTALRELGFTWDSVRLGAWYGEDSDKLDQSEKSIFLRAAGYYMPEFDQVNSEGISGYIWTYDNKNDGGYDMSFSQRNQLTFSGFKPSSHCSAHFVQK